MELLARKKSKRTNIGAHTKLSCERCAKSSVNASIDHFTKGKKFDDVVAWQKYWVARKGRKARKELNSKISFASFAGFARNMNCETPVAILIQKASQ